MQLVKLFVALSLGIILSLLVGGIVSLVYHAPVQDEKTCAPNVASCDSVLKKSCTMASSDSTYGACAQKVYEGTDYKKCIEGVQNKAKACIEGLRAQGERYNLISLIIYSVIGILFVGLGFALTHYETLGVGMIFGGVSTLLSVTTSGTWARMFGGFQEVYSPTLVVKLLAYAILLVLLFLFCYKRLDKEGNGE